MDDADHDRRHTRPLQPFARGVDRAAVGADPAEARGLRVTLADGVGGDQAKGAALPDQVERSAEEVGHEVGVAVRFRE